MPIISHLTCSGCGHEMYIMNHLVFFDGTAFVTLHHPGERDAIARLGSTEARALAENRLFYNAYCVCLDCASVVTRRTLRRRSLWGDDQHPRSYRAGNVTLWITVSAAFVLGLTYNWPLYAIALAGIGPAIVVDAIADRLRRPPRPGPDVDRSRQPVVEHEDHHCSHCGSARLEDYLDHLHARPTEPAPSPEPPPPAFRCPQCGDRTLHHDPDYWAMA